MSCNITDDVIADICATELELQGHGPAEHLASQIRYWNFEAYAARYREASGAAEDDYEFRRVVRPAPAVVLAALRNLHYQLDALPAPDENALYGLIGRTIAAVRSEILHGAFERGVAFAPPQLGPTFDVSLSIALLPMADPQSSFYVDGRWQPLTGPAGRRAVAQAILGAAEAEAGAANLLQERNDHLAQEHHGAVLAELSFRLLEYRDQLLAAPLEAPSPPDRRVVLDALIGAAQANAIRLSPAHEEVAAVPWFVDESHVTYLAAPSPDAPRG